MAVASTYTKAGNKATNSAKLDKKVFGVDTVSHELLKQAYTAYLANGRVNLANTKTRGEVRGGGKKPWRQKGTGRARFGSSRVPIWRGGGITFGPTGEENYTHRLPLKAKRAALRQALSLKAKESQVIVVEALNFSGKTAEAAGFLQKINATGNVLLVVEDKTDEVVRAVRNLPAVIVVQATYINVFDVLNADAIVITSSALQSVHDWLGGEK